MLALLLSVSLFVYWFMLGYAALSVLNSRRNTLQNLLLAPAVGLCVTLLPIFWINRAGIPVKDVAIYVAAALLILAVFLLRLRKPLFPLRRYLPFAGVLLFALVWTGRPMLEFGLDWMSYSNNDMANYSLMAMRMLNHGFGDVPAVSDLILGKDYSQFYWFLDVAGMHRPGSQEVLAAIWAVTGLNAHQIFMPTILGLHMSLISAVAGLVCDISARRRAALGAASVLCFSAMSSLGVLYQLIAQVFGLTLLAAAAALTLRNWSGVGLGANIRHGALSALVVAGLLIVYPEVIPFLVLAVAGFLAASCLRRQCPSRFGLYGIAAAILICVALLNRHLVNAMLYLLFQMEIGFKQIDLSAMLFPFFLVPSGLANLWGIIPIGAPVTEPWLSLAIGAGITLFIGSVIATASLVRKLTPLGYIVVVMLLVALQLFVRNNDFGLFKLAMFAAPFLTSALILFLFQYRLSRAGLVAACGLIAVLSLPSQLKYINASRGESLGGFAEIPNISKDRLLQQFNAMVRGSGDERILSDTNSMVFAKLESLYTIEKSLTFPSRYYYGRFLEGVLANVKRSAGLLPELFSTTRELKEQVEESLVTSTFDFMEPSGAATTFVQSRPQLGERSVTVALTPVSESIFNNYEVLSRRSGWTSFAMVPLSAIRNHLVFVHSSLGNHYYIPEDKRIALYQLERDPLFPNGRMAGLGRYLLLQALNPTPGARIMMDITSTLSADGSNLLPPVDVIGQRRESVGFIGRGCGRIVSPPLTPQIIGGQSFFGFDIGREGKQFRRRVTGLMNLYGRTISLDQRHITVFGRDFSMLSAEDFTRLSPPATVQAFPSDLTNKALQYSGIYEDGWVSEAAFFILKPRDNDNELRVQGMVPMIDDANYTSKLDVYLEGKWVASRDLKLGDFDILVPVKSTMTRQRIDLRFNHLQRLPGGDDRPIAAKLYFVGFAHSMIGRDISLLSPEDYAKWSPPRAVSVFPTDLMNKDLKYSGIYGDGWVSEAPSLILKPRGNDTELRVKGMVPMIDDINYASKLEVYLGGKLVASRDLKLGDFDIRVQVESRVAPQQVDLRFSHLQRLPRGDNRLTSARLSFVGFTHP